MARRKLAWPVAISIAAHAVLAGWLAHLHRPTSGAAWTDGDDAAPAAIDLVEVSLLEPATGGPSRAAGGGGADVGPVPDSPAAGVPDSPAAGGDRRVAGPRAAAATDRGTGPGELPANGDRKPGEAAGVALPSAKQLARSFEPELGPPPPPSPLQLPARRPLRDRAPRSEIRPDGTGAYRSDDLTFRARVGRDGRVSIADKPNFHARIALPGTKQIAEHLQRWSDDPYGESPMDERSVETHTVKIVDGGFDLTDWAIRASGGDPYYHRKQQFLDRTRDERARMRAADNSDNLRDSVRNLRAHLTAVWRYRAWSASMRRRALFELWDDCAERGSDEVVAAAAAARATILAFIRANLPADGPDRYSAGELEQLNRNRSSKRSFAPYDPPKSGE